MLKVILPSQARLAPVRLNPVVRPQGEPLFCLSSNYRRETSPTILRQKTSQSFCSSSNLSSSESFPSVSHFRLLQLRPRFQPYVGHLGAFQRQTSAALFSSNCLKPSQVQRTLEVHVSAQLFRFCLIWNRVYPTILIRERSRGIWVDGRHVPVVKNV